MMVNCIRDSGIRKVKRKKVTEYKFGQMAQNLKDFGKMIWQMVTGDSF